MMVQAVLVMGGHIDDTALGNTPLSALNNHALHFTLKGSQALYAAVDLSQVPAGNGIGRSAGVLRLV